MRKLQKEIEEMEEKGLISDPVTYQQACKMPYLQAVMKEAMRFVPFKFPYDDRMHPATGLTLARVVPKGGAYLCGRKIEEGVLSFIVLTSDNRRNQQLGCPSQH
jgi:hypothetical protein